MNRPSHWIIATFAVMGPVLWVWGFTAGFGSQHEGNAAVHAPRLERLESAQQGPAAGPFEDRLVGRVVDQLGQAVAGAEIRVLGGSRCAALTRTNGAFEVMVKLRDPYRRIAVAASGFSTVIERCAPTDFDAFVAQLSAPPPWQPQPPLPLAPRRAALAGEGFVQDADKRPVAGVVVTALQTGESATSDDVGRYLIPIAAPATSFLAWHPSGRCAAIEPVHTTQSEGMVSLGVTSLAEGGRLSGSVRLPDGAVAPAAAIVLRREGMVRRCLTDEAGAFRLGGLVAGDYDLEVLATAGALGVKHPLRVEGPGSQQTELHLVAEAPLRVRVVDQAQAPRAGAYVLATDAEARSAWAQTDAEGVTTLRGLAAGAQVQEARGADLAPLKIEATSRDGDTTTIVTGSQG